MEEETGEDGKEENDVGGRAAWQYCINADCCIT